MKRLTFKLIMAVLPVLFLASCSKDGKEITGCWDMVKGCAFLNGTLVYTEIATPDMRFGTITFTEDGHCYFQDDNEELSKYVFDWSRRYLLMFGLTYNVMELDSEKMSLSYMVPQFSIEPGQGEAFESFRDKTIYRMEAPSEDDGLSYIYYYINSNGIPSQCQYMTDTGGNKVWFDIRNTYFERVD